MAPSAWCSFPRSAPRCLVTSLLRCHPPQEGSLTTLCKLGPAPHTLLLFLILHIDSSQVAYLSPRSQNASCMRAENLVSSLDPSQNSARHAAWPADEHSVRSKSGAHHLPWCCLQGNNIPGVDGKIQCLAKQSFHFTSHLLVLKILLMIWSKT